GPPYASAMQSPTRRLQRAIAALAIAAAAPLAAAACAPSPPPPVAPPPPPPAPVAEVPDAGAADAQAPEPVVAAVPAGPAACPADMVLIDGDYCTDVEVKCLRSTYAKQNKKTICHEFQPPARCVGKKVHKRFCIDRYEYPNKKGERPEVMHHFPEAQHRCAAQNKRVGTETEGTTACEGPTYKPYPYGYIRDPNKCRGDRTYRSPNVKKTVSKNKQVAHDE